MRTMFGARVRTLLAGLLFVVLLVGSQAGSATRCTASASPTPGPEEVTVGVYIQNVQHVDLATNSFAADFYVWLRWRNPDIDAPGGVEVQDIFESANFTKTVIYPEPRRQSDGSLVWLARYQGDFTSPLSVADYPFQKQALRFVFD